MSKIGTNPKVEEFYHSSNWKRCRAAFKAYKHYTCEICGGPGWLVHHKTPLTEFNVDNPDISLNFDNLQLVCLSCHDKLHHFIKGNGYVSIHHKVSFDKDGNVIVDDSK